MNRAIEFLAAAYCASEYSLAEQRVQQVPSNTYTNAIKVRSEFIAKDLATIIESQGYKIVLYAPDTANHGKPLLYKDQPLFQRGDAYFDISGKGGLFIAAEGFESDLSLVIEPNKDGVRLMAGKFDNEVGFDDLLQEIGTAKSNL
ncbi:TPA: hypothetical protein ACSPQU_002053 [Klebsiella pneumoniae]|uniref:hypothetical protein n=1 Tax=Klebsiella TaxID=570 RepID=UPI00092D6933|nr:MULTISPECIES: hypothetical protein [Klebsiella]HBR1383084.1 hypothetical protein [Klebsiella quasipneumoniae subsp. similipneumoniae]HDS6122517.1 hypothetical protein [Klebsiella pneumoniae subsp. pneumoniae]EKS0266607.1 hypothetical protein [Klebsiella pneumoniae]EKT9141066.1 hypothetical protein [Klebsiella variicola]EMB0545551.1 hypothetical protein [Klebsiella pneumoniae]